MSNDTIFINKNRSAYRIGCNFHLSSKKELEIFDALKNAMLNPDTVDEFIKITRENHAEKFICHFLADLLQETAAYSSAGYDSRRSYWDMMRRDNTFIKIFELLLQIDDKYPELAKMLHCVKRIKFKDGKHTISLIEPIFDIFKYIYSMEQALALLKDMPA